ncbi:hypothetical protein [Nesterenkonia sp. HG001]|uniref:hypothetical protein n=1 Tax=Nesterenkonia sp. HG001 TaxID=2983207 RepID=UPI002AC542DC|nr:hypothetical protein [Nesterenkonia sp. HG001]MDZ5076126.1 hypothetical protein [Nesterenkonia sp. HG001]
MSAARRTASHPLLHAGSSEDSTQASQSFTRAVDAGRLLRLRRGVYIDPGAWLQAPPWDRHLLATAATRLAAPGSVICRETALAVHGVDQLRVPEAVHLRTWRRQEAGIRPAPRLVGRAGPDTVGALLASSDGPLKGPRRRRPDTADLAGVPTRRVLASSAMRQAAETLPSPATVRRPLPDAGEHRLHDLGILVEPLGLVLADTLPRMEVTDAVVVLDSVRSGRWASGHRLAPEDVEPWTPLIRSRRGSRRWASAWARSDSGAESVGESLTRLRVEDLGFETPETQVEFVLPDGRTARVDLFWRSAGIVGEFDGWAKYTRNGVLGHRDVSEVVYEEKVREDGLRALGLGVARFIWTEVQTVELLRQKLVNAGVPRV